MVGKGKRGLLALCLALLGSVWSVLPAQNEDSGQVDSLLRLEKADYVEQLEAGDDLIRKVANPVFLHNGTYLQCDTSLWSRNTNIINCIGNVVMTQGDAVLTSDSLVYYVDDDLARFRGSLVELQNAEGNVLRTRELDYNTRDSLALFHNGASMRSEDGQIIESDEGSYSNPRNYFVFRDNVNMFTDSVFVRTNELDYDADAEFAMFKAPIDFWKEENMLSARGGWYRKLEDIFFFENDVRALGETQETWSDTLYYYRKSGDIEMHGHVQLQDTSRSVASVSEYLYYCDSLSSVTLLGQAAIALWEERGGKVDTTYCGADSIFYRTLKMCDIPEEETLETKEALNRLIVKDDKYSCFSFRHFILGSVAIFLYVGVEVGIANFTNIYLIHEVGVDPRSAGVFVAFYWFFMFVGRLVGGSLGSKFSGRDMLQFSSIMAIILILITIFTPEKITITIGRYSLGNIPVNVVFLVLSGLFTSVMWGSIYNLSVDGLGKYTSTATGFFMMMVCGGGILPFIQGAFADLVGCRASFWLVVLCLVYIMYYGSTGHKNVNRKIPV